MSVQLNQPGFAPAPSNSGPTTGQPCSWQCCMNRHLEAANRGNPTSIAQEAAAFAHVARPQLPFPQYPSSSYHHQDPSPYRFQGDECGLLDTFAPHQPEWVTATNGSDCGGGAVGGDGNGLSPRYTSFNTSETNSRQQTSNKRNGEDPLNPRGDKRQRAAIAPPKRTDGAQQYFACPFLLRDGNAHRPCIKFQLSKVSYVRQHILRKHLKDNYCPVCGYEFKKDPRRVEWTKHITAGHCEQRELDLCATQDHWAQIKNTDRGGSEEERWYKIWDILFPGITRPSSPYISDPFRGVGLTVRDAMADYQHDGTLQKHMDGLISPILKNILEKDQSARLGDIISKILHRFADYADRRMEYCDRSDDRENTGPEDPQSPDNLNSLDLTPAPILDSYTFDYTQDGEITDMIVPSPRVDCGPVEYYHQ